MHAHRFIELKNRSIVFKPLLGLACASVGFVLLTTPVQAASAKLSASLVCSDNNDISQACENLFAPGDTVASVPELKSEKPKKAKKKSKTSVKPENTQTEPESGIEDEDDNDNDMYVPYEKWRMDTFDNWGRHKKKKSVTGENDGEAPDSTNTDEEKKGFSDKEKESMLMFYVEMRLV